MNDMLESFKYCRTQDNKTTKWQWHYLTFTSLVKAKNHSISIENWHKMS